MKKKGETEAGDIQKGRDSFASRSSAEVKVLCSKKMSTSG